METHAHHLHKAPGNKFRHYFFEFLMLFLAVFCGFLAENFREHQIEKEKAKQYIESFYEDLKADTARLTVILDMDNKKIYAFKNLTECYNAVSKNLVSTSCMGELIKYSKASNSFLLTDRTLRQLAYAGGFRMLAKEDADSILSYESLFNQYHNFESTIFQEAQNNVRNTLNVLADFNVNKQLQEPTLRIDSSDYNITKPLLFSNDRFLLNKYFNELLTYRRVTKGQLLQLINFKIKANGLIDYFKNKYHLE